METNLTVLRCPAGQSLAKRWLVDPASGLPICRAYDKAWQFAVGQMPVPTMGDLHAAVHWLASQPDMCVIRGEPAPDVDRTNTLRRSREKDGQGPTFLPTPRRWFCLDLDHLQPADLPDLRTAPAQAAEAARALALPPCLRDVSMVWQWSASAGMNPKKAGLHLWYLLDTSVSDAVLTLWLRSIGGDASLVRCVQPHYTASPLFGPPLVDPMIQRVGLLRGDRDTVPSDVLVAAHGVEALKVEYIEAMARAVRFDRKVRHAAKVDAGEVSEHLDDWATCAQVAKYLKLATERRGHEILCDCRRHFSSSKRSLTVDTYKDTWYCFGCERGGKAKALVEWQFGPTMTEANVIWLLRLLKEPVG
jgi:hypothetical protein